MPRPFPIPYIVYWLLVKDFFYNVDVCDSSNSEPGHCLSNSECSKIGTNIGSCDSEMSSPICCKITFNYFNETYLLQKMFVRKSQTEVVREMVIFSSSDSSCGESFLQYGNRSINLKKKEMVYFIPEIHVSETPDRIIWSIWVSYSRESRDLKRQPFGTNQLYVVELNKLVADEHDNKSFPISECVSESDEDNKFYTFLNPSNFPIRKLFTKRMQKLNTLNLTIDGTSFIQEIEPEKRSRRSVYLGMDQPEDLICKKQQLEDALNVEGLDETENIKNELEISHDFVKQIYNSKDKQINHNGNIDSVINYVLKTKVVSKELMEDEDINEEWSSDKENGDKIASDEPVFKEHFSDSNINSKEIEEKRTVAFEEISLFDKIPIKGDSTHELNRHLKPSVYDGIRSPENEDIRKSVKVGEVTHDMRNPVQLEATHDMRKPVQVDKTHNIRKPVKVEATHDMRKPVEIRRGSVQKESTHDMRKPVTSDESHDLRWPVLEGENDLRNLYRESDAYGSVKSSDYKSAQRKRDDSKDNIDENVNSTLQNSFLDCKVYISLFSKKVSSMQYPSEKNEKHKQLKDLWEEASRVCGKYNGDTTGMSSSIIKEKWSWMVSLHENISGRYKLKCSASLLNSLWVVTVAHCVDMKPKANMILILGNQHSKVCKENVTERTIDEIVIHPKFHRGLFENDLALLRMKTPVTFQSAISPICLPWNVQELTHGIPVFLGLKPKDERTNDDLQDLTVPIMTNYECEILYSTGKIKEKIEDTFLCAGKKDGNCDIESGSSLIAPDSKGRWSLIGLVSWGSMCTNPEQPAVYIKISSYAKWIKDVIDCYEILI